VTTHAEAPRYREIERALRARIASLRPGQRLPSDSDLCAEFGVSRMTARHAMQQLAEDGLIERDPGRGTFVAEPPAHRRADSLMTFSREMRRRGRVPSSRLVARVVRAASPHERADLDLAPGDQVVSLRRIRVADREPIALEEAVLPARCAPAVLDADLEAGSLHEALIAAELVPTRGHATIGAAVAGPEDAALLEVAPGDPLLVERRVILDQHGRPLERTESRYAADRYALGVSFSVEDGAPRGARRRSRRAGQTS
jgi:GntR family transcriptional regulator